MKRDAKRKVAVPGAKEPTPESTQSDPDEAIAMAQSGKARHIAKPRAEMAPAIMDKADPERPDSAAVNAETTMTEEGAKELDRAGKIQRSVLTENGWYCPQNSMLERQKRKKAGETEMVEID